MPRTLVTGAAGFLGSHLCDRLLGEGWDVIGFDSLLTGRAENLADAFSNGRFRFEQYDVTNYLHVDGDLDWVLHFASPASPTDYLAYPIQTLKVGALGTLRALGLAKAKDAGLLLASTSEVYGNPQVHPQPETYWGHVNPIGPRAGQDRPHLQHVRPPHAPPRRPCRADVHRSGPAGIAVDGARGRLADEVALLRRRPGGRHLAPADVGRRRRTGEPGKPRGGEGPGPRADDRLARRQPVRRRLHRPARRRSGRSMPRHLEGDDGAWVDPSRPARRRTRAHDRVGTCSGR